MDDIYFVNSKTENIFSDITTNPKRWTERFNLHTLQGINIEKSPLLVCLILQQMWKISKCLLTSFKLFTKRNKPKTFLCTCWNQWQSFLYLILISLNKHLKGMKHGRNYVRKVFLNILRRNACIGIVVYF